MCPHCFCTSERIYHRVYFVHNGCAHKLCRQTSFYHQKDAATHRSLNLDINRSENLTAQMKFRQVMLDVVSMALGNTACNLNNNYNVIWCVPVLGFKAKKRLFYYSLVLVYGVCGVFAPTIWAVFGWSNNGVRSRRSLLKINQVNGLARCLFTLILLAHGLTIFCSCKSDSL